MGKRALVERLGEAVLTWEAGAPMRYLHREAGALRLYSPRRWAGPLYLHRKTSRPHAKGPAARTLYLH